MIKRESKMSRNFPSAKVFLVGGLVLLIFLLISLAREIISSRKIDSQISDMATQVKDLERKNGDLMGSIGEWQSGNKLEKELRLKMGLKKPNEKAILIVDNSSTINSSSVIGNDINIISDNLTTKTLKNTELSNPAKWWRYFFEKNN